VSPLRLAFLGPLEIVHPQRGDITLTNRKALALLAYLATESRHSHSRESLLGLLWPDMPDADARNNLRVTWSQLRTKLGDDYLLSTRLDMQFNLHSAHWLDVTEFHDLLESCAMHAHSHVSRNDCPDCIARMTQAVALYRGDFVVGFFLDGCAEFDEWLTVQRERFRNQALALLSELASHHERTGQYADAEGHVRRLLQLDPLREDAHRQLMRLLLAQDQRTAALAQFEVCKRLLAESLGVEPDPDTLALAASIRSGSAEASQTGRHNLPTALTRFFGREAEIATLTQQLGDGQTRLVTLTGSGGVGKTRLALRVAYDLLPNYADGIWLVELAPVNDELAVARAVAAALGVREQANVPTLQVLCNVVRAKHILLVIDNCEHVLHACASLITQLLTVAPRLTVLTTSRTPLHIADERVHRVPSLPTPESANGVQPSPGLLMRFEAVQLFVNRASSAHTNFALQAANTRAVAQICRRLDGIPLALELAAARVKVMPVEALAQRLDSRFKLLTSGDAEALPRHRTLHALVGWSYDLLTKPEQAVLRQLSVFVGGWTLEAAEAVCVDGENATVLDNLINLVDHSLVVFGYDAQQQRYTLLETIRQFANERLQQTREEQAARARHARYYAHLVAQAVQQANTPSHQHALNQVELERANIFAALSWAIGHATDMALDLENHLGGKFDFWEMRGYFDEGRHWQRQVLAATQDQPSTARAKVLLNAARLERAKPDYAQALVYAQASYTLSDDLGDAFGRLDAQMEMADIGTMQGDIAGSQTLMQGFVAEAERLGHQRAVSRGLYAIGLNYFYLHDYEPAKKLFEQCLRLYRERGDALRQTDALHLLAVIMDAQGDAAGSIPLYEELVGTYRELGYRRSMALVENNMGCALLSLGEFARARHLFVEGLLIRREMGLQLGYVYSFINFGQLAAFEGKHVRAAHMLGAAEALSDQIDFSFATAQDDLYVAAVTSTQTALGEARFKFEWSRGRGLTAEQAIELALHEPT